MLFHQGFANEHGIDTCCMQKIYIGSRSDPTLADYNTMIGDCLSQFEGMIEVGFKRVEIAIIDADDPG